MNGTARRLSYSDSPIGISSINAAGGRWWGEGTNFARRTKKFLRSKNGYLAAGVGRRRREMRRISKTKDGRSKGRIGIKIAKNKPGTVGGWRMAWEGGMNDRKRECTLLASGRNGKACA